MIKLRLKTRPEFTIVVADDSPLVDHPQFETVLVVLAGLTEEQARILFDTDFTGVIKGEDGLFTAGVSAIERAERLNRL